jgi:hypothetical protein
LERYEDINKDFNNIKGLLEFKPDSAIFLEIGKANMELEKFEGIHYFTSKLKI